MSQICGIELKQFDASSLTASYQTMGSTLSNPAYSIWIDNDSDVDVFISRNGTTDEIRVAAGKQLPLSSYARHNTLFQASSVAGKGTQFYIKQDTAPGTGTISLLAQTLN